jgi:phage tail-like protein
MPQEYPLPRFQFQVDWGGATMSFTEVTGLVMEREKIEYRSGDGPGEKLAMVGLPKHANVICKRAMLTGQFDFNTWFQEVTGDGVGGRRNVTVLLLNPERKAVAGWTLVNSFVTKLTAPDLKSDANEIAIESIEIAHEGLRPLKI